MRATPAPALLLVLAAILAGCAGAGDPLTDVAEDVISSDAPSESGAGAEAGARPAWAHGDWWQFRILYDPGFGEPLFDAADKIVVSSMAGDGYQLSSGGRDLAVIDAEIDMFFVGPLDKDLGGPSASGGGTFRMFDWPLGDGSAWETSWTEFDQENGDLVDLPMSLSAIRDGQTFRITGTTESGTQLAYTYDPTVEWFTDFTWTTGTGALVLSMALEDHGAAYQGTFTEVDVTPLLEKAAVVPFFVLDPTVAPTPDLFTMDESYDFVLRVVGLFRFGFAMDPMPAAVPGTGAASVIIQGPSGVPQAFTDAGSGDAFTVDVAFLDDFEPGEYAVAYGHAGSGVGSFVMFHGFVETVTEFTAESHTGH